MYCVAIKWDVELTWEDSYGGCWEGETLTTFDSVIRVGAATVIKMYHNRCETSVWRLQRTQTRKVVGKHLMLVEVQRAWDYIRKEESIRKKKKIAITY